VKIRVYINSDGNGAKIDLDADTAVSLSYFYAAIPNRELMNLT